MSDYLEYRGNALQLRISYLIVEISQIYSEFPVFLFEGNEGKFPPDLSD